jgi:phosphocarrier protein
VVIPNPQGLHMRPVLRFVDLANQFDAQVQVAKGEQIVDGKSPMEMMLLEGTCGTELTLLAQGAQAAEAIEALGELVADGFGEMEPADPETAPDDGE